ncbi:MAG: hypothetical protein OXC82_01105 [Rhodobacteraceae bacterium]|nr:hypothetical protein [Paracoccaceae bacterium]MCY4249026.1 hypothetical protein [Paracoccaceae bacterium]MCY4306726.1 hypothetical protein [Paracoccaceae bacterium]
MVDRPIGLLPSMLAPVGPGFTYERINTILTESIEHDIIGSAQSPS